MKRAVLFILSAGVLLVFGVVLLTPADDPEDVQRSVPAADADAQIALGKYLALAGNCAGCHTARGGAPY
ncbi:MAG: cytochrome c, partial [Betaproteobacteria bacterium]|nr:cytochrome c [Betaproteobacteria bacterium]